MSMEPFQQQDSPLRPFSVQRGLPPSPTPSVRVVPYIACRTAIDFISPTQSICALSLHGRMMGIRLSLEEVVNKRQVPAVKAWETIGTPKLLVIPHYRMGFELTRTGVSSLVRVCIDCSLPIKPPGSWFGHLPGVVCARWCTKQMVVGATRHFT